VTLLTEAAADRIGAKGIRDTLQFQWTNNVTQSDPESRSVSLSISGADGVKYEITNARTIQNLVLPLQSVDGPNIKKRWDHLKEYTMPTLRAVQPTILLGQDDCHLIIA